MKLIEKKVLEDNTIQLTIEEIKLFGLIKKQATFICKKKIDNKFGIWLNQKDNNIASNSISFKLDELNNNF